jgi:hypothetical protein
LMKWYFDEMASWWNGILMKWQVDEMSCWCNSKLIKWQVDEMISWWNDSDQVGHRWNGKLTKKLLKTSINF